MPEEIIIDGMEEHAFRRSIEIMLRDGRANEAVERLKALLPECAGEGKILPARLLELSPEQINLGGWDQLAARIEEYSRPTIPITAIGIGIGDPEDLGLEPDAVGNLRPPLATSYYSDATFPFSETDRADLLEGYSSFGCEWQGDHDRIDETLSIEGIDDLYGAITRLENQVAASDRPDPELIRAGAIGACYLGVMVWQAARRAVIELGLPRPMAILLVNSDAYPFFDAPVMTCDEYLDDGALQVVEHQSVASFDDYDAEEAEAASLLDIAGLGAHRPSAKKMALVLGDEEAHNPLGMADELVAQAAFEPDTVDVSRFLPDASEFRNEPDEEFEPEAAPVPADEHEIFDEPDFPVDFEPAKFEPISFEPADFEPAETFDEVAPEAALAVEQADSFEDEPGDFHDDAPTGSAAWLPPEWATEVLDRQSTSPGASDDADVRIETDTAMPWHGHAADLPFESQPVTRHASLQPASHSIRARIRSAPVENNPAGASLIARFLAWVGKMLSRR